MAGKARHTTPELSVVIVNYNVRDFLHHALVSLRKAARGLRTEFIVVDNASDDGSADLVRRSFPGVRLIVNRENVGFARANNIALRSARGEFILLINPDTVVQEDTLRTMVEFLRTHRDAGLAGCKILNADGSLQRACRRSFPTPWVAFTKIVGLSSLFPKSRLFGRYNLTYRSPDESYAVDAVSGSFMMARREVVRTVGGLDENFFMYGEDLDWCYRIQQAGWSIWYVHTTQIIHYKGESTRRSSIDEVKTFYGAMHLFVRKHFGATYGTTAMLRLAIMLVSAAALVGSIVRPLWMAVIDGVCVFLSMLLAEWIWRGGIFLYPTYAYPAVFVVPALIVALQLSLSGVYTDRRMSLWRSVMATGIAFVFIAALTAFFKTFAFSRMMVLISGTASMVLIPGWRALLRWKGRLLSLRDGGVFGKRTLIVGTGDQGRELLRRLRLRPAKGYDVVGFIDITHQRIGQKIDAVPIVGTLETVGKVAKELRISDVIVAPKFLSYTNILSMVSRLQNQPVAVHLVPSTMEVLVGKASVDHLEDLPLVQITYNIERPMHRVVKRTFDIIVSGLLLTIGSPILYVVCRAQGRDFPSSMRDLLAAFNGRKSLVGPPSGAKRLAGGRNSGADVFLGKAGVTGLVQLQRGRRLTSEEVEQYNLYYARNQSAVLDFEILLKALLRGTLPRTDSRSPGVN